MPAPRGRTYLGGLCGAEFIVFIVFKAYEWPTEVAQGHTISSNGLPGLLIMGVVARELRNPATSPNVHG